MLIAGAATVLAVMLGTLAAYAFSRFRIKGESDLLFFILSTRMLPPIVVLIPIFLMFTKPFAFLGAGRRRSATPACKALLKASASQPARELSRHHPALYDVRACRSWSG